MSVKFAITFYNVGHFSPTV